MSRLASQLDKQGERHEEDVDYCRMATSEGPTMFARIGVMQALNRGHVREFNPKQKEPHWGRRKLVRDQ